MKPELPDLVQRFFTEYLTTQRNLSAHTCHAYRDTFRLLLSFLSRRQRCPIDRLSLDALTPEAALAFLDHLESVRHNTPRTRNLRLAAIRTFVRFVLGQPAALDFFGIGQRLLAIPQKKASISMPGFLTRKEIDAVLAATDPAAWSGQRDRLLFTFLYNTGARISEALQLRPQDVRDHVVHLHGKGRKERAVPIWPRTARMLRQWCKANHVGTSQPIFISRTGASLSHDGAALRLALAVRKATGQRPSLRGRRVTCHTFRHSCAMSLLQAGVALEVIALWLGHAQPVTTHGYVEADLKMKSECLRRLTEPHPPKHRPHDEPSRLLAFLEAI